MPRFVAFAFLLLCCESAQLSPRSWPSRTCAGFTTYSVPIGRCVIARGNFHARRIGKCGTLTEPIGCFAVYGDSDRGDFVDMPGADAQFDVMPVRETSVTFTSLDWAGCRSACD